MYTLYGNEYCYSGMENCIAVVLNKNLLLPVRAYQICCLNVHKFLVVEGYNTAKEACWYFILGK